MLIAQPWLIWVWLHQLSHRVYSRCFLPSEQQNAARRRELRLDQLSHRVYSRCFLPSEQQNAARRRELRLDQLSHRVYSRCFLTSEQQKAARRRELRLDQLSHRVYSRCFLTSEQQKAARRRELRHMQCVLQQLLVALIEKAHRCCCCVHTDIIRMGVGGGGGGGGGSTESSLWATLAPNLEDSQEMLILAPVHSDCPSSRGSVLYCAMRAFISFSFVPFRCCCGPPQKTIRQPTASWFPVSTDRSEFRHLLAFPRLTFNSLLRTFAEWTLTAQPTLRASLSGTFLQGRKDVVNRCLTFVLSPTPLLVVR